MLVVNNRANTTALGLLLAIGLAGGRAAAGIDDLQGTKPGDLPNGGYFDAAEACANCHKAKPSQPPEYREYFPIDTWAGTMMGNAARDPVFFAALTVANQDMDGAGTFCLRCHSPIGFVRGHATPADGSAFDEIDQQGVGCDSCHRATPLADPADPAFPYYLANAQLLYTDDINKTKHGPYADANSPNHEAVQDLNIADSRFCGQCHQVTNPEVLLRDATGAPTTLEFPLDTTYEEWAASDYADGGASAQSCIDCHMRKMAGEWPITNLFQSPLRPDPRDHALVGGNHWGIQAVMQAYPERAMEHQQAFQMALDRTLESLESAATVTLVDAPAEVAPGATFEVRVRVENLTGHKFPTGYAESRRAWVALALVDAEGQERTLLGGYDAATGEIQAEPPTHVYRAVHGLWNAAAGVGEKEEHLALHDMILSDTRIPPRGFVPSETTMPTAEIDFSDGAGGYRHFDEATFTVTAPVDAHGAQKLSARVYYQSMTREYVEFLRTENTTDSRGEELHDIYMATGEAPPILVASAEGAVDLGERPGTGGGGPGSGGGDGSGGAGAGGTKPTATEQGDEGGCGCRAAGAADAGAGPLTAAALAGLALCASARRRRRS
jgi:hypothetical protein